MTVPGNSGGCSVLLLLTNDKTPRTSQGLGRQHGVGGVLSLRGDSNRAKPALSRMAIFLHRYRPPFIEPIGQNRFRHGFTIGAWGWGKGPWSLGQVGLFEGLQTGHPRQVGISSASCDAKLYGHQPRPSVQPESECPTQTTSGHSQG